MKLIKKRLHLYPKIEFIGDKTFAEELGFAEEVIKILEKSNKQTMNTEIIFRRKDRK